MDRADAISLLGSLGVDHAAHPGQTLRGHLLGTFDELVALDAAPHVRVAGLCHAVLGTDGFPDGPLRPAERPRLRASIGAAAERLVHLYSVTTQDDFVARASDDHPEIVDRRDGSTHRLDDADFDELLLIWLANELELLSSASTAFLLEGGPVVWAMLRRNRDRLPSSGLDDLDRRIARLAAR